MNTKNTNKYAIRILKGTIGAFALSVALLFGTNEASAFSLGPTTPGKWGPPAFGTGATVTYSYDFVGGYATDSGPSVALSAFMPVGYKVAIDAAFGAWSAVADLTFVEVPDFGEDWNALGASGDIRLTGHAFDGPSGTLAHGYFPPANGASAAGDIHFDTAELWETGFGGPGFDIFQVAAHEIGHAIGLEHSATPASLMNPFYTETFSGPQADDIAGAVFIYGPSTSTVPSTGSTALFLGLALSCIVLFRRKLEK